MRVKVVGNPSFNRQKMMKYLSIPSTKAESCLIYLQGGCVEQRSRTDVDLSFRQESNFLYLTGINDTCLSPLPIHLIISFQSNKLSDFQSHLFISTTSKDDSVWIGPPLLNHAEVKKLYKVDHVHELKDMKEVVGKLKPKSIYTLSDVKLPTEIESLKMSDQDTAILTEAITKARLYKSKEELELMQIANNASSQSHEALMAKVAVALSSKVSGFGDGKLGVNEDELKNIWYQEIIQRGCLQQAYLPIVAYGPNAAILHYTHTNDLIPYSNQKQSTEAPLNSFLLVDAGGEYQGYASDITRTYPISGKFETIEQKQLYTMVLNAQKAVLAKLKSGVEWEVLHRLAVEEIAKGLINAGVIKSSLNEKKRAHDKDVGVNHEWLKEVCWTEFIVQIFFPHGLGHLIGLDVHDVGGYPKGVTRIDEPGTKYLRMRRKLETNFVVTVEPGCYFVPPLINEALNDSKKSKYLNADVIKKFIPLGGVRIEDCVVVTDAGFTNLTTAVKEITDIEALMRSAIISSK